MASKGVIDNVGGPISRREETGLECCMIERVHMHMEYDTMIDTLAFSFMP
jgi:hypothetical protein